MASMTIAFDIDGVLANLCSVWLDRYNEEYQDTLTPGSITRWNIHELVKCGTDIYKYLDASIYDEVRPYPNALQAVKLAKTIGRVIFCTIPTKAHFGAKYNWLNRWGFDVTLKDYIECGDKSLIRASVLIDDNPANLRAFKGSHLLVQRPWNYSDLQFKRVDFSNLQHFVERLNYVKQTNQQTTSP